MAVTAESDRDLDRLLNHVWSLTKAGLVILIGGRLHQVKRWILKVLRYSPAVIASDAPTQPAEPPVAEPEQAPVLIDCKFADAIRCDGGRLVNGAGMPYGRCPSCDGMGKLIVTSAEYLAKFYGGSHLC